MPKIYTSQKICDKIATDYVTIERHRRTLMLFNSFNFILFFPITVLCYYLIPAKFRHIWLLICSYYFYMSWNIRYALLLALSTLITYMGGILMERAGENLSMKRFHLFLSFTANLLILFFFKYITFAIGLLTRALSSLQISFHAPNLDILLPVGISFYTFQALSYAADVYKGRIRAEHNLFRYALFVSFFPQLVAGPIERSGTLLTQFQNVCASKAKYPPFDYEKARSGLFFMLFGYFEKMVIAERASLLVDSIYNDYTAYEGFALILATFFFAIQIYCDFGGYSHIAIGAARILGFDLMDNFHQPYFAVSIQDFWHRWHISLSTWFRDYLYIPLGGNRGGRLHKYKNLMITFLASGLWHGAGLHFVIWGFLHGLYQIAGDITMPVREKLKGMCRILPQSRTDLILRRLCTFCFVCIAWVFFRANGIRDGIYILLHSLRGWNFSFFTSGEIYGLGLPRADFWILICAILVLLLIDFLHERQIFISKVLQRLPLIPRWLSYFLLVLPIFLQALASFGKPASSFIYFQF